MADPTYSELKKAFIRAIRPLFERELPEALPAIDAYLAHEWPKKEAVPKPNLGKQPHWPEGASHKHTWIHYEITPEQVATAPARAQTTLRKQHCLGRVCTECRCVSNWKYPYWFHGYGNVWTMKTPPCIITPFTEKA